MSRAATPCHLLIAGLMLASAARASAQAQAPAQAPTQAPAQAPGPVEAPAPVQAPPEPVAFSCPVRGPFGPGTPYYSQFYEDYVLSYVFQDTAKGTYVDVGAYDPDTGSVTKSFYLKGWRGVNVEPNPDHLAELLKRRPEDANLGVGISDVDATLTFYKFETRASGLSTFDSDTAERHRKSGFTYEELTIPVVPLTEAL